MEWHSDCSFQTDNEAPIITCSGNVSGTVDPGSAVGTVYWPTLPTANDTVDGPLAVKCRDDSGRIVDSGDEFPVRITTVTCEASDNSGNRARCSFEVTVTGKNAQSTHSMVSYLTSVKTNGVHVHVGSRIQVDSCAYVVPKHSCTRDVNLI